MTSFADAWREAGMIDVNFQPTAGTYNVHDRRRLRLRRPRRPRMGEGRAADDRHRRSRPPIRSLHEPQQPDRTQDRPRSTRHLRPRRAPRPLKTSTTCPARCSSSSAPKPKSPVGFKDGFMNVKVLGSRTDAPTSPSTRRATVTGQPGAGIIRVSGQSQQRDDARHPVLMPATSRLRVADDDVRYVSKRPLPPPSKPADRPPRTDRPQPRRRRHVHSRPCRNSSPSPSWPHRTKVSA